MSPPLKRAGFCSTNDNRNNRQLAHVYAKRRARGFFCFVFFVATKKMMLLSGNPDGLLLDSELKNTDHAWKYDYRTQEHNKNHYCNSEFFWYRPARQEPLVPKL